MFLKVLSSLLKSDCKKMITEIHLVIGKKIDLVRRMIDFVFQQAS